MNGVAGIAATRCERRRRRAFPALENTERLCLIPSHLANGAAADQLHRCLRSRRDWPETWCIFSVGSDRLCQFAIHTHIEGRAIDGDLGRGQTPKIRARSIARREKEADQGKETHDFCVQSQG